MIRAEAVVPASLRTSSSSVLWNGDGSLEQASRIKYREHLRLKTEIVQNELPLRLNYCVYMFLKKSRKFAKLFVSGSCSSG